MFFNDVFSLLRVVIFGTLAYLSLVLLLRVSGKRTLSKMNAFDLVVTVAIGSTWRRFCSLKMWLLLMVWWHLCY
jgi:uncharacterized membrane protein YcaP (DUF421 family)